MEAHQCSIWLTLEAWRRSWLGFWLAGWRLAGWLLAGWLLAGWAGDPRSRHHANVRVKCLSPAGYSNQFESLQERKKEVKKEAYKIARLEDWKGFKAVRLQDWKGFKAVNLGLKASAAWWPLKGPADFPWGFPKVEITGGTPRNITQELEKPQRGFRGQYMDKCSTTFSKCWLTHVFDCV